MLSNADLVREAHCPPGMTWLLSESGRRVRSARLIYSQRQTAPA